MSEKNIFVEQFERFPHELQRAIINNFSESGASPFGSRLVKDAEIFAIKYTTPGLRRNPDGSFQENQTMSWQVGTVIDIPNIENVYDPIQCEITRIVFDWVTSIEIGVPVYVIIGRRTDGHGSDYPMRYVAVKEFEVTCKPPRPVEERGNDWLNAVF